MICIKCSAEIPDGSIYCNICGTKQDKPTRNVKKRGNGQGTVWKRPSGTWAAQVTLGYYIKDGKRKRKTAQKYGFKTKKDAVAYIQALYTAPVKPKVITLSELWERFQSDLSALSASNRSAYRKAWKRIESAVAYRTIDTLTVSELQELVDSSAETYDTRKDIKFLLSHFYKIAIRDDFFDKNRSEYIKLPVRKVAERQIFTADEIKKMWDDFESSPSSIIAGMITMLYTGMRPGELLKAHTENVHLDEHYLTGGIKTTKGKNRKIIIPDKLVPVIEYLLQNARNGKLLYYNPPNEFYSAWKQARSRLEIREALSPYCCRHTYITNLTALKVSPAMLQELVGHEDYDTTLLYTHLSVEDRLQEVNKL